MGRRVQMQTNGVVSKWLTQTCFEECDCVSIGPMAILHFVESIGSIQLFSLYKKSNWYPRVELVPLRLPGFPLRRRGHELGTLDKSSRDVTNDAEKCPSLHEHPVIQVLHSSVQRVKLPLSIKASTCHKSIVIESHHFCQTFLERPAGVWAAASTAGVWAAASTAGVWAATTTGIWAAASTAGVWAATTTGIWAAATGPTGLSPARPARLSTAGAARLSTAGAARLSTSRGLSTWPARSDRPIRRLRCILDSFWFITKLEMVFNCDHRFCHWFLAARILSGSTWTARRSWLQQHACLCSEGKCLCDCSCRKLCFFLCSCWNLFYSIGGSLVS